MKTSELVREFKRLKLGPFIEVPCSLLSEIISALARDRKCDVINPANEAIAAGIAAGSYLASGSIPMVLTQNSGLCNMLNAHTSLNLIYNIPVIYLVSWRGEPGTKDAPEHIFMGKRLEDILRTFDIPYKVLSERCYKEQIAAIVRKAKRTSRPAALLLREGLAEKELELNIRRDEKGLSRAEAVASIAKIAGKKTVFVTTNGFISREAFHVLRSGAIPSFYMLGSMGHALPIGLGIERHVKGNKKVVIIDGDGGCLMHLGAMASAAGKTPAKNLIHTVLDNGVYASVGGQPTVSADVDFPALARSCGYRNVSSAATAAGLERGLAGLLCSDGPSFFHVRINLSGELPKSRVSDVYTCKEIKENFMNALQRMRW